MLAAANNQVLAESPTFPQWFICLQILRNIGQEYRIVLRWCTFIQQWLFSRQYLLMTSQQLPKRSSSERRLQLGNGFLKDFPWTFFITRRSTIEVTSRRLGQLDQIPDASRQKPPHPHSTPKGTRPWTCCCSMLESSPSEKRIIGYVLWFFNFLAVHHMGPVS